MELLNRRLEDADARYVRQKDGRISLNSYNQ